jgi:methylenetetrahydrofolate dehydrogenase (NADP+)/methenyltetrahydrofolate cyclohydrolase
MRLLDGKALAEKIRAGCAEDAKRLSGRGIIPGLAVILAGDNPASQVYVAGKEKACLEAGFHFKKVTFPASVSAEELKASIRGLNADKTIHGVLVQLPLPEGLDEDVILEEVSPDKDVDGIHAVSLGRLVQEMDGFVSCTPQGVMVMLEEYGIVTVGKHAVVIGRSRIVGKPMALLLSNKNRGNATVTVAHSRTKDLAALCRTADILVAAIGKPKMVTKEFVKEGAVVVDVGITRIPDPTKASGTRLVGDVDFEAVKDVCSWITPVPGGVGPMTIAMLLKNTVKAAERS